MTMAALMKDDDARDAARVESRGGSVDQTRVGLGHVMAA
jgi:hypothetical protein